MCTISLFTLNFFFSSKEDIFRLFFVFFDHFKFNYNFCNTRKYVFTYYIQLFVCFQFFFVEKPFFLLCISIFRSFTALNVLVHLFRRISICIVSLLSTDYHPFIILLQFTTIYFWCILFELFPF